MITRRGITAAPSLTQVPAAVLSGLLAPVQQATSAQMAAALDPSVGQLAEHLGTGTVPLQAVVAVTLDVFKAAVCPEGMCHLAEQFESHPDVLDKGGDEKSALWLKALCTFCLARQAIIVGLPAEFVWFDVEHFTPVTREAILQPVGQGGITIPQLLGLHYVAWEGEEGKQRSHVLQQAYRSELVMLNSRSYSSDTTRTELALYPDGAKAQALRVKLASALERAGALALPLKHLQEEGTPCKAQGDQQSEEPAAKDSTMPPTHSPPPGMQEKYLEVFVRSQKNDQNANGQWILVEPTWSPSCLATLLHKYCSEFGVQLGKDGPQSHLPLFMSLNDPSVGISYGAINSLVKKAAKKLGLPEGVTAHSMRIGGCTAACGAGVPMEIVRAIGGWHSEALVRYIRAQAAPALGVSSKMGF